MWCWRPPQIGHRRTFRPVRVVPFLSVLLRVHSIMRPENYGPLFVPKFFHFARESEVSKNYKTRRRYR